MTVKYWKKRKYDGKVFLSPESEAKYSLTKRNTCLKNLADVMWALCGRQREEPKNAGLKTQKN